MPTDIETLKARLRERSPNIYRANVRHHRKTDKEAATALDQQSARIQELEGALRAIAEGNLGDGPGQANYARIKQVALAPLPKESADAD